MCGRRERRFHWLEGGTGGGGGAGTTITTGTPFFCIPYEVLRFGGAALQVRRHDFMHCECSQTHFWNVLCRACSPLRPYGSFERPPFCCFTNKPNSSLPKITGARKPAPKKKTNLKRFVLKLWKKGRAN